MKFRASTHTITTPYVQIKSLRNFSKLFLCIIVYIKLSSYGQINPFSKVMIKLWKICILVQSLSSSLKAFTPLKYSTSSVKWSSGIYITCIFWGSVILFFFIYFDISKQTILLPKLSFYTTTPLPKLHETERKLIWGKCH